MTDQQKTEGLAAMADSLLNIHAVAAKIGLGRTWIKEAVAAGRFPAPYQVGAQAVRWRASEVDAWIAALPQTQQGRAA